MASIRAEQQEDRDREKNQDQEGNQDREGNQGLDQSLQEMLRAITEERNRLSIRQELSGLADCVVLLTRALGPGAPSAAQEAMSQVLDWDHGFFLGRRPERRSGRVLRRDVLSASRVRGWSATTCLHPPPPSTTSTPSLSPTSTPSLSPASTPSLSPTSTPSLSSTSTPSMSSSSGSSCAPMRLAFRLRRIEANWVSSPRSAIDWGRANANAVTSHQ
ncbi:hypothetical protein CRUP_021341 [Coryphaenoides rupestris]|nr:hypothetical protein CRUP_021341 [Coryphaenoides rupestris]